MPISHSLLIDNWTLQNVGELLCNGLDGESSHDLVFNQNGRNFKYDKVSADVIRFEALCQFLNCIVFADSLYVDAKYIDSWAKFPPVVQVHTSKILVKKPFTDLVDEWIPAREAMADRLCVNAALLKKHRANKRSYAKNGQSADPFLAQILWGGAGMLARADFFRLSYIPHPSRERLFRRANFLLGPSTATAQLSQFIATERVKLYGRIDGSGFLASVQLPPVAVQIIEDSTCLEDLVKTALQVREEFRSLRRWLATLQRAMNDENTKEVVSLQKAFESVSRHMNSYASIAPQGDTNLQIGISWLKVGVKAGSPVNALKNLFGMRAELNRLILTPAGHNSLKKFLKMQGEQHTKRGRALNEALIQRLSTN